MFNFGIYNYKYNDRNEVIEADMFAFMGPIRLRIPEYAITLFREKGDLDIFVHILKNPGVDYPNPSIEDESQQPLPLNAKLRYINGILHLTTDTGLSTKISKKAHVNFIAIEALDRFNIQY